MFQPPEKKKSYRELREEELAKERALKAAKEAEEVSVVLGGHDSKDDNAYAWSKIDYL